MEVRTMTEVYRDSVVSCQPFLSNADLNGQPVGPFLFLGGRKYPARNRSLKRQRSGLLFESIVAVRSAIRHLPFNTDN